MPTLNFPSPDVANPGDKVHTGDVTWVFTDKGFWSSEVGEAGGGASVHYGPTAPDSPSQGDLWYADDSTVEFGGRLYIYTGTEWVDTSLPGGGSGESGGTEVGSLQTVTDNGAVTTNACEFGGGVSVTGGDVVNAVINSDGSATFAGTINGTQMFLEAPGLGANLILTNTETGTDKTVSATFRAGNNVNKAGITAGVWNNNLQHGYLCFQTTLANSLDTRALITAGGDFRVNPDGLLPGSKAAIDLKSDGSANFNSGNLQIREFGDKSVISLRKDGQNQVHFGATDTAGVIGIDYRSSNFTAGTEVIKLNGDTGSATFAGRIESKGSGSSSVFVTRDVTTGDEKGVYLFRGSRNINGGATENVFFINQDGSGSFAGDVQVGGDPAGGANAGCDVRANGSLVIAGNSSGDSAITIYDAGNSSGKISLNADGSAEFAGGSCTVASSGRINIDRAEGQQYCFTTGYDGNTEQAHISGNGAIYSSYGLAVGGPGTTQGAGNAVINADGSAEFAGGEVTIFSSGSLRTNGQIYVSDKTTLSSDGSATFAGNIQSGGAPESGAATGSKLKSNGAVLSSVANTGDVVYRAFKTGGATDGVITFKGDGSSSFAGDVTTSVSGLTGPGFLEMRKEGNIRQRYDGSPDNKYAHALYSLGTNKDELNYILRSDGNIEIGGNLDVSRELSNPNISLRATDGSATFAGGVQFKLAGDGAGTTDSLLLDDYEEGRFTPTFGSDNAGFTATYADGGQVGRYTKIGNIVHCEVYIRLLSTNKLGTGLTINGLPYLSINSSNYGGGPVSVRAGFGSRWPNSGARLNPGANQVILEYDDGSQTTSQVRPQDLTDSSRINFCITYTAP